MRLAFVAPPFAGHFNPLFGLAKAAHSAGYEVEFVTGPRKLPVIAKCGMRPVALHSIDGDALEAIANTAKPVGSNPLRLLAQLRQNLSVLPAIEAELHEIWKSDPPELVVADSVAPVGGLIAERLGIPWITTIATPFSIENRRGTPSYCGGWAPMPGVMGALRDAAGRGATRAFKVAVSKLFRRELAALGLRRLYRGDGSEVLYSPQSILGFGIRELEFERDWPAGFQMIGPLIDAPEDPPALTLSDSGPNVLVTHGTHLMWAKRQLVADVVALARTMPEVNFVLSLGEPERAGETGEQVDRNVRVEPFIAYGESLERFDAMIHHGGAGVSYAAILAGIPSLVIPRDYDQFDYAARVEHHRLGLRLRSLDTRPAARAMERLLDRRAWPALGAFQKYARAYTPQATFLKTVHRMLHAR